MTVFGLQIRDFKDSQINKEEKMTIVCVDDHPIMLKGLSKNIRQLLTDADNDSFANAEEVEEYLKEMGCDVLISEINLVGVDGLTLAQRIQNLNSKVNIIFLTVCDEKEHPKEVMRIKPSGYLVKPAKIEQREAKLRNLRYSASAA